MIRVYVAGKLNSDAVGYLKNVSKMCQWDDKVRRHGDFEKYSVYNPCLDLMMGVLAGDYEYKHYFNNNLCWLEVSQVVFVCPGWETSEGTKREIERAKGLGIPVVFNLEELDYVAQEIEANGGVFSSAKCINGTCHTPNETYVHEGGISNA